MCPKTNIPFKTTSTINSNLFRPNILFFLILMPQIKLNKEIKKGKIDKQSKNMLVNNIILSIPRKRKTSVKNILISVKNIDQRADNMVRVVSKIISLYVFMFSFYHVNSHFGDSRNRTRFLNLVTELPKYIYVMV